MDEQLVGWISIWFAIAGILLVSLVYILPESAWIPNLTEWFVWGGGSLFPLIGLLIGVIGIFLRDSDRAFCAISAISNILAAAYTVGTYAYVLDLIL